MKFTASQFFTRMRDPLGELPTREEIVVRVEYQTAKRKAWALELAREYGANVEGQLAEAKHQLVLTERNLPRGHTWLFIALCLVVSLTVIFLTSFYLRLRDLLLELWGSPENYFLHEYRPVARQFWNVCELATSSLWFAALPPVFLLAVWWLQNRLPRWQARRSIYLILALYMGCFLVVSALLLSLMI